MLERHSYRAEGCRLCQGACLYEGVAPVEGVEGWNVFVYGTLKGGGRLHSVLRREGTSAVGLGMLLGHTLYSAGSFPLMVETGSRDDVVVGETWHVRSREVMCEMDAIEYAYERKLVRLVGGQWAWTYVWTRNVEEVRKACPKVGPWWKNAYK